MLFRSKSQYGQTGKRGTYMLVCGTTLKAAFTTLVGYQPTVNNYTAILQSSRGQGTKWQDTIESFTGDFGTYDLVLSNWLGFASGTADVRRGYAIDTSMLELKFNKQWSYKSLPDLDGGPRGVISAIFGLCVKSPLGLAKFAATSD